MTKQDEIARLCREAMHCNACFADEALARSGPVTVPQPRPVPDGYWRASPKIALVLANPNSGDAPRDRADNVVFDRLLRAYRDGGPYGPVAEHIRRGLRTNWFGGTFNELYLQGQGFGLDLDTLALANIAWCATRQEDEKHLWKPCFKRHTGPLLRGIDPDVVLLCGDNADRCRRAVLAQCHNALIAKVVHCSALNRPPRNTNRADSIAREAAQFRQIIATWHQGERGLYRS
jgi:hypothetical protein